jgi:carboxymethylenebutenolidase
MHHLPGFPSFAYDGFHCPGGNPKVDIGGLDRVQGGTMKRRSLVLKLVLVLLCCAPVLSAQDWAQAKVDKSPRHREWVVVKHDGRSVQTFVVYPEVSDKRPVVLIIHEIFGMTDWVQDLADQVAAAGYIAVAPDLLSGMAPNGGGSSDFAQGQAVKAVSMLNPDQITQDLNAVADYALKIPSADGKLYVAGFCWGGSQSFRFATNRSDLSGAFVFYGGPPPAEAMARINAPVYGFYGGNDERIGATIPTAREEMKAAGKVYEPVTYEGAGHGFMRAGEEPNATPGNKKARDEAWTRWKSILAQGR